MIMFFIFSCIHLPLIPNVKAENLPDVVVSSIEISPQQLSGYQPFMLIFTVTNLGLGKISGSYLLAVNITKGATLVNSISYGVAGNLSQDESVSLSWTFINGLPGGIYTVKALADPWHFYAESDETNNKLTFNFTIVASTVLTLSSPANAKIGETVTLRAKLTDSHSNPLRGETISFRIGDSLVGSNVTDSTGNAKFNYRIAVQPGTYTVSAQYSGTSVYISSSSSKTIRVDPLTLTITSDVINTQIVSVNGTLYTTDASGKVVITINQLGAYAVQILTPYNLDQTTRIALSQWNDGTTSNQKTITIDTDQSYSITTKTQYYLSVTSAYGNIQGSGWYDSGSSASFSVSPTSVSSGFLTNQVFKSWAGDYTGTASSGTITMNSPKEITAQWTTDSSQLYLLLEILPIVIIIILVAVLFMRRKKPANEQQA